IKGSGPFRGRWASGSGAEAPVQKIAEEGLRGGTQMQLGIVGLGRMGANMARRLIKKGHECVVFDRSPKAVNELVKENGIGAASLADLASKLTKPRAVWLMVPAAAVDKTIRDLVTYLEAGDIL